jgi:AraC-like DNA-binding protein
MTTAKLLEISSLLAVFVSSLLALFLLTARNGHRLSNSFFGTFLLLNAVDISSWFVNGWLAQWPALLLFKISLNTLINPAFYLYVVAVCYSDFRWQPRYWVHLGPFALLTLVLVPHFYAAGPAAQLAFLRNYSSQPEAVFGRVLGQLQFGFYMVAVFRTLRRYQHTYVENYANAGSITYRWLWRLALSLTGLHAVVLLKEGIRYSTHRSLFEGLELWVGLSATVVLCWWLLQALHHPELFRSVDSRLVPVAELLAAAPLPTAATPAAEPAASAVPEGQARVESLRAHMERAQPYLDPDLTIQALATQLEWPVRELSLLINHHLGQHFFDFVNEYRIREAKRQLRDPTRREQTVLEILYAVGFNSKSSFNTSFKKLTGQTPTQFRSAAVGSAQPA